MRGAGLTSMVIVFFFSSRRRHTILQGDWSSDVCSSDLVTDILLADYAATLPVVFASSHSQSAIARGENRSEEHTSELQSPCNLVCRLLLEKKKKHTINYYLIISCLPIEHIAAMQSSGPC